MIAALLAVLLVADQPKLPAAAPAVAPINGVVMQGLDKTTARITKFTVPLGQTVGFGTLRITAKDCRKSAPEEDPESAAFLTIVEARSGQAAPVQRFGGWMFASSPALSALEHPVYDVWVVDCSTAKGSPASKG